MFDGDLGGKLDMLIWINVLTLWVLQGLAASMLWRHRGGSEVAGFWLGALLGPIGLIIVSLGEPGASARGVAAPSGARAATDATSVAPVAPVAGTPARPQGTPSPAPVREDRGVRLIALGLDPEKIGRILEYRGVSKVAFRELKSQLPATLPKRFSRPEAAKVVELIEEAGGKAELVL